MKNKLFLLLLSALLVFSFAGCGGGGGGGGSNSGGESKDTNPDISLSETSLDYAGVVLTNSLDRTIEITNAGDENLIIGQIAVSNPAFSIVAPDACSNSTLAPNQKCTLSIRFAPGTTQGQLTATLSIPSNDPDEGTVTVALAGEGYGLNVWVDGISGSCDSRTVEVTVTDPVNTASNPIVGLDKDNFQLFENGQPISTDKFSVVSDPDTSPVSLVMSLDWSTSLTNVIPSIETAAMAFIDRLNPTDEGAVCKFHETINFNPDSGFITADGDGKVALKTAIDAYLGIKSKTLLYDALYASIARIDTSAADGNKRAIIVFSDGSDSDGTGAPGSDKTLDEVIAYANFRDVAVFTILYVDPTYLDGSRGRPDIMQELASETGGQFYNANTADLDDIFRQISSVLTNKYIITYESEICSGTVSLDVRVEFDDLYGLGSETEDIIDE